LDCHNTESKVVVVAAAAAAVPDNISVVVVVQLVERIVVAVDGVVDVVHWFVHKIHEHSL
jgi:hypothetical protein